MDELGEKKATLLIGIAAKSHGTPEYVPKGAHLLQDTSDSNAEAFCASLAEELPFTDSLITLSATDEVHAHGLFQWLANQLLQRSTSSIDVPLLPILYVCSRLDRGTNQLWKELASLDSIRADRLQELEQLINSRKIEIAWLRREMSLDKSFEDACLNHDWKTVDRLLSHMLDYLYDEPISSAFCALNFFSPLTLERVLSNIQDVVKLVTVLASLERIDKFEILSIAERSSSWPLKFLALRLSLERNKISSKHKFEEEYIELLCQAAKNDAEWIKWVEVLNTYPSRYPTLQRSMGSALCTMGHDAVVKYFGSIHLSMANRRTDLLEAFQVVQKHHDKIQRQLIWTTAFQKWNTWNFDEASKTNIFKIRTSPLDLAVAEYYRECLSEEERNEIENEMRSNFTSLQIAWHEEFSAYISALNRNLSRYQPFGHVKHNQGSDGDWAQEQFTYHPKWIPQTSYWKIKNRLD